MKRMLTMMFLVFILVLSACGSNSSGGSNDGELDLDRARVVIGSGSTGGDTYQIADATSRNLEDVMDTNMKVDAIGADQAFNELSKAKDDGSTMFFFHDMTYLSVLYETIGEEHDLDNYTIGPIVATNPGNALLTSDDAPYDTLEESGEWLADNPDETITVAIEGGGVSEVIFDLYYFWVEEEFGEDVVDRLRVYVTGGQEDKDQALWDDDADIIYGTVGANAEYTKDDVEDRIKMKFLGLAASEPIEGHDIPTFKEQGIEVDGGEAVFDKEFFFLLPEDVDENVLTTLDEAAEEISESSEYEEDLDTYGYTVNYKSAEEAEEYLLDKRDLFDDLIERAPDLDDISN